MEKEYYGRQTGAGAFTESRTYDSAGEKVPPRRETSKSGSSWTDFYDLSEGQTYLVLTEDFSNSGKDNSWTDTIGEGMLSVAQKTLQDAFFKKHPRARG